MHHRINQTPSSPHYLTDTQLIISLYQPNTPEGIASTQAALARIQSLPQAWPLSKQLLSRPDEKVQFFGVLTIIIKLNTERYAKKEHRVLHSAEPDPNTAHRLPMKKQ